MPTSNSASLAASRVQDEALDRLIIASPKGNPRKIINDLILPGK
jgi:hypothetical protein